MFVRIILTHADWILCVVPPWLNHSQSFIDAFATPFNSITKSGFSALSTSFLNLSLSLQCQSIPFLVFPLVLHLSHQIQFPSLNVCFRFIQCQTITIFHALPHQPFLVTPQFSFLIQLILTPHMLLKHHTSIISNLLLSAAPTFQVSAP